MAIQNIRLYPDPVLLQPSAKYDKFPGDGTVDPELEAVLLDLRETSLAVRGIGMAAPQIGFPFQVALAVRKTAVPIPDMGTSTNNKPMKPRYRVLSEFVDMINPKYERAEKSRELQSKEGCLSFPGIEFLVKRFSRVSLTYQKPDGTEVKEVAEGGFAIEVQHEIDHLNGKLVLDLTSTLKRPAIREKMKKLNRRLRAGQFSWPPRPQGRDDAGSDEAVITGEETSTPNVVVEVDGALASEASLNEMAASGFDFRDGVEVSEDEKEAALGIS